MPVVQFRDYVLARALRSTQLFFVAGVLAALLGFVLPWFDKSPDGLYSYSGLKLLVGEGLVWIGLLFVGYAGLLISGATLLGRGLRAAGVVVVLALALTLGALMAVGLAASATSTLYGAKMPVGLLMLCGGHALFLGASAAAWVMQLLRLVLTNDTDATE